MYKGQKIEVIDCRDMLHPNSELRSKLFLPQSTSDEDCFSFLVDLTARYPLANIGVDEVPLKDFIQKQKVHDDAFEGTLWLAVSWTSLYDFRDTNDKQDLTSIPILQSQGFEQAYLTQNKQNGSNIVEESYKLHDGIIEPATIQGLMS